MRLHATEHDLAALQTLQRIAELRFAAAGEGDLGDDRGSRRQRPESRIGAAETLRILLGDENRQVQLPRRLDEDPGALDHRSGVGNGRGQS